VRGRKEREGDRKSERERMKHKGIDQREREGEKRG
jgi:hypothetical protein